MNTVPRDRPEGGGSVGFGSVGFISCVWPAAVAQDLAEFCPRELPTAGKI